MRKPSKNTRNIIEHVSQVELLRQIDSYIEFVERHLEGLSPEILDRIFTDAKMHLRQAKSRHVRQYKSDEMEEYQKRLEIAVSRMREGVPFSSRNIAELVGGYMSHPNLAYNILNATKEKLGLAHIDINGKGRIWLIPLQVEVDLDKITIDEERAYAKKETQKKGFLSSKDSYISRCFDISARNHIIPRISQQSGMPYFYKGELTVAYHPKLLRHFNKKDRF
jgi:hypothetical protein